MKKKIRALTLGEIAEICGNNQECRKCPLREYCPNKRYDTPDCMIEELDNEIEL